VGAMTLLPGVLDLCRHRLPARRHPVEPRCYWKNLQLGSRTRRPQHRLQATHAKLVKLRVRSIKVLGWIYV
jgi:hypothetical protein